MPTALSILSASLLISTAPVTMQDTSLWRYTTDKKIEFYQVSTLGDLLVATKEEIVALNPETGEVRWSRDDILKPPVGFIVGDRGPFPIQSFNPIPSTPYGVVRTNDGIVMIDVVTGSTLWDSTAVPLEKVRGHLTVPQQRMLLVYGETPESRRTMVAVEVATGEVRWRQDTLFDKSPDLLRINGIQSLAGHQPPVVDSDTTFILNISKDGPMRIHSRTGALLWRADTDEDPPMLREGYGQMLLRDGVLFVPYKKKMLALDTRDGSIIWDRRRNFRSRVFQMELTPHGLVVRGRKPPGGDDREVTGKDFFVDLVDPQTGESVWEDPFKDLKVNTPFLARPEAVFVARERRFVRLEYGDGAEQELAKFKFEKDEKPEAFEMVGENFLVSSAHNFLFLDPNGAVQRHTFFKAPGMSFLETVASIAALSLASAMDSSCARDPNASCSGWIMETEDGREVEVGEPSLVSISRMARRQFRSVNAADYAYVYTEQPAADREGFSLLKMDKRNGQEAGRVWIDERRPEYVLDPITGFVFVKDDDKEIFAMRFPE